MPLVFFFSAAEMSADEKWQLEMNAMLQIVEKQSEISLRKINHCFQTLNRPFTDEFKQYFFKMTTQRYLLVYLLLFI